MGSPLGKYSEVAALVTALGIVAVWLLSQIGVVPNVGDGTALAQAAALAIGLLLGQRSTTNGAAKIAAAAHQRIDAIEAATNVTTHPET